MGALAYVDKNNRSGKIIPFQIIKNNTEQREQEKQKENTSNRKAGTSSEVYAFKTFEEIQAMIDVFDKHIADADTPDHERIARRNKMLFIIGTNISIRGSDISQLRWKDFFYKNLEMKEGTRIQPIKTRRTGKYVTLFFNQAVRKGIEDYISLYPIEDLNDYLFSSRKGESISRMSIGRIIKSAAKEAGIKQNINSHSLRKTFGYWVWHDSKDKEEALTMLQIIFGHNSTQDTKKYIGICDNDIKKVFNSICLGVSTEME